MGSAPTVAPARPGAWPMYRSMVGVGLACGLLIVSVFELTRPVIQRNRAEALRRAIFQVLPDARSSATFALDAEGRFARLPEGGSAPGRSVYAGYDGERRLVGLAIEASGMGYQDVIRVLYGYSLADEAIVGIRVLESRETPGLGDKIETDPAFLENFVRLDATLTEDGSALAHAIEPVKRGKKEHPWQVDGITGATISSAAIAKMLNESAAAWLPTIQARQDDFRDEG